MHRLGFLIFLLTIVTIASSFIAAHNLPIVPTGITAGLCALIGVRVVR